MSDTVMPRNCMYCGTEFEGETGASNCPECNQVWAAPNEPSDITGLATVLNWIENWRRDGLLKPSSYQLLRRHYESQLATRRSTFQPTRTATSTPVPKSSQPEPPHTEEETTPSALPNPRLQSNIDLARWAAERQADILLYLGAFLLIAAAIVFVDYQGETLVAEIRIAVLAIYTAGLVAAGVLLRRWERIREAGPVFLLIGALLTPLNFVLLYTELLDHNGISEDVVWLLGSGYSGIFYAVLAARSYGRIYALFAVLALLVAWRQIGVLIQLPDEWFAAWFMALTTTTTAIAANRNWLGKTTLIGVAILTALQTIATLGIAADNGTDLGSRVQLPVSLLLLTVWLILIGIRLRDSLILPAATTTATGTVIATLWAADVSTEWYVYPILISASLAIVSRSYWAHWDRDVAVLGWIYSATLALAPLALFFQTFDESWHGAVSHLGGASIFAAIAWRNCKSDLIVALQAPNVPPPFMRLLERMLFGWIGFGLLLLTVALAQRSVGIERPDTGWAFLMLAVTGATSVAILGPRHNWFTAAIFPLFATAVGISLQPWDTAAGHNAILLGIPALALISAFVTTRRYSLAAIAMVLAAASAAAIWNAFEWETWTLAGAYGFTGAVAFLCLTPLRRYGPYHSLLSGIKSSQLQDESRTTWLLVLSWGLSLAAPVTAAIALAERVGAETVVGFETAEYRALVLLALVIAPLIAFEGLRLNDRRVLLTASALTTVSLLMAIAIAQPENVQAYTIPSALYLIGVGMFVRQSPQIVEKHLSLHEMATIAGALVLVAPQVEQSFEHGGAWWGFVLLIESAAFLATALLRVRWLTMAGVLTAAAVGIRWLAESGETLPYWVTLGIGGMLLVAAGTSLLFNREWWDQTTHKISKWWEQSQIASWH